LSKNFSQKELSGCEKLPKNKHCATAPLHLQTGAILIKPRKDLDPSLV
jgi:hypothetical protein